MSPCSRRQALGSTVALCPAAALAATPDNPAPAAQARQAIEAYARAWAQGDLAALVACYHLEFTLNYFGRNALAGRHVGKAAALQVLGAMRQRTERRLVAIHALMAGAGQAAMSTREALTAQGRTVEVDRLYVYTVAGEQLRECWVYDQDQRLVDELIGS